VVHHDRQQREAGYKEVLNEIGQSLTEPGRLQRGEVYFISLNPTVGREQAGRRPVVVVSRNILNNLPLVVCVVPGTRGIKVLADYLSNARVPAGEANLAEETVFMTFHARAVDHSRFKEAPIGQLRQDWMDKIDTALAWTFNLQTASPGTP